MAEDARIWSSWFEIEPGWIDYNDHLNMGYYTVLFDRAVDEVYETLGFGPGYIAAHGHTTYSAEYHVQYLRELKLGDRVRTAFTLADYDEKRFHSFQEMYHEDGWLAATGEGLTLHVDMSGPRVAAMPDAILRNFADLAQKQADLPHPEGIGRAISIPVTKSLMRR